MKYTNDCFLSIYICFMFLIVSFVLGYACLRDRSMNDFINLPISDIVYLEKYKALTTILKNNLKILAIMIIGAFSFGYISFLSLGTIGFNFGMTLSSILNGGYSACEILILMSPHSILELISFVLGSSLGVHYLILFIKHLLLDIGVNFKALLLRSLKISFVSIVLMIIAAFIESYITFEIARAIAGKH